MTAAVNVQDLTIANYLKIVSMGAVYNNLSMDCAAWDYIKKKKKKDPAGRQLRYNLRSAFGHRAVGFLDANGSYPQASRSTLNEATANYKEFGITVEVERSLIMKAIGDIAQYGEPLAEELESKASALRRVLSASLYGDGSGALGTLSAAVSNSSGTLTFTMVPTNTSRGFIGWVEVGDAVVFANAAGTQKDAAVSSGTISYYKVLTKSRVNSTFTAKPFDATDADLSGVVTGVGTLASTNVIYRKANIESSTFPVVTAPSEYNTVSKVWPGFESLFADDARVVHGLTMSGQIVGTRFDCGTSPIDSTHFQQALSQMWVAIGPNRYKYDSALMAYETYDSLIESRETDRRFTDVNDARRGAKSLGYLYGKTELVFTPDEFCPKNRIFVLPTDKDVLQYWGSEFEQVEASPGQKFYLKPNSSGHDRLVRAYFEGHGTLISVHPAGTLTLHNFT